jgi:predicted DNA-binding ribbon-helix-helix protein
MSEVIKRSVHLAERKTSISLEDEFWNELKRIADKDKISLSVLITQIDDERPADTGNLSSAIRLYVLEDAMARAAASEKRRAA